MNTYPINPLSIGQANFSPYLTPVINNPVVPNYQPVQSPVPQRHIDCVNGKDSAYAFQMGPNSSAILVDNLEPKIWIVTTDASGYKAVKGYRIIEDVEESSPIVATVTDSTNNSDDSNSKWKQDLEDKIHSLEERLLSYEQSNNQYAFTGQSNDAVTQSNDRNGQSIKGSNGSSQSNGRK